MQQINIMRLIQKNKLVVINDNVLRAGKSLMEAILIVRGRQH